MDRINDYFQGRLDPEQEHEMQAWLAENSDKAAVVEELECIFNSLSEQTRPETDDAFIKVTGRLGISMRRRRILKWVAGVAASVLLPFVGIGVYQAFTGTPESIVWTETRVPFGQQQKLCLSDGTILYLNSGSRITYPTSFGDKGIREIFVSGEIYAEVESDPDRPFIINSGDVGVRVLGTKFNLKAYENSECVELFLMEGAVNFEIKDGQGTGEIQLKPGNAVQYDRKTGKAEKTDFRNSDFRTFKDGGAIHFFNITLRDISYDLERIFCRKIIITNEELAETRFVAHFTNGENLAQILSSLSAGNEMKIVEKEGVVYLSLNHMSYQ